MRIASANFGRRTLLRHQLPPRPVLGLGGREPPIASEHMFMQKHAMALSHHLRLQKHARTHMPLYVLFSRQVCFSVSERVRGAPLSVENLHCAFFSTVKEDQRCSLRRQCTTRAVIEVGGANP